MWTTEKIWNDGNHRSYWYHSVANITENVPLYWKCGLNIFFNSVIFNILTWRITGYGAATSGFLCTQLSSVFAETHVAIYCFWWEADTPVPFTYRRRVNATAPAQLLAITRLTADTPWPPCRPFAVSSLKKRRKHFLPSFTFERWKDMCRLLIRVRK